MGSITSLPTPDAHNTGTSPNRATETVMILGPEAFGCAINDGFAQIVAADGVARVALPGHELLHGVVEVNNHDHARFYGDTEQRNEAHRYGHRQVYPVEIHHVGPANQGKRNRNQTQKGFPRRPKCQIERQENDDQYHRRNDEQRALPPNQVFVLPAPFQKIAVGQFQVLVDFGHGFLYRTAQIPVADVEHNRAPQQGIVGRDHGRAVFKPNRCHRRKRNGPQSGRSNGNTPDSLHTVAVVLRQPDVDGKAPASFDGLADR